MAAKDWYRKYSMLEAEGMQRSQQQSQQRSQQRPKISKEQFRRDILRLQAERKQRQQGQKGAVYDGRGA
jgi:hypothetical protein